MSRTPESPQNTHNERLYDTLNTNQQNYVTLRLKHPTKTKGDVAEMVGVLPETVYRWPKVVERAYEQELARVHEGVLEVRKAATITAMNEYFKLLSDPDANVRERAARNLLEWELGKAVQRSEISGGDTPVKIELVYPE